jgi:hypothetical protein
MRWVVGLCACMLFASCASTVLIQSDPPGAILTLDGKVVGTTPYFHTDRKVSGYSLGVKIEAPGYATKHTLVRKTKSVNIGAIFPGGFFIFPLAWTLGYPSHERYSLTPDATNNASVVVSDAPVRREDLTDVPKEIPGILITLRDAPAQMREVFVVALDAAPCRGGGDVLSLEEQASVRLLRHYEVLERRGLEAVLSEAARGMNGLFDEQSVVEAGQLAGAEGVVLIRESCVGGQPFFSVKLVDCTSSKQIWAATAEGRSLSVLMESISDHLSWAAVQPE